jgi:hypothetical protein
MKNSLVFFFIMSVQLSYAQVYEGKIDYNKTPQAAIVAEYKYPEATVEKTLTDKLERMGYKVKSNKGFLIISNAVISSISSKPMEYAFKIEKKSKKEKDITVVSLVMNENNLNNTIENSSSGKSFLTDLSPAIDAVNTDNMVNEQYDAVVKSQKKLKNLQDDQMSMEKKVRNLQDDLKANAKEQEDKQIEIKKQQEVLDAFKAKKGSK